MTPEVIGMSWLVLCCALLMALGTRAWLRRPPGTRLLARMRRTDAGTPADAYPWNISFLSSVALMCALAATGSTAAQHFAVARNLPDVLFGGLAMLIAIAVLLSQLKTLWCLGTLREQSA